MNGQYSRETITRHLPKKYGKLPRVPPANTFRRLAKYWLHVQDEGRIKLLVKFKGKGNTPGDYGWKGDSNRSLQYGQARPCIARLIRDKIQQTARVEIWNVTWDKEHYLEGYIYLDINVWWDFETRGWKADWNLRPEQ